MEEGFYNKLKELYPLYERVKKAILLVENFDEKQEMYVAPINELRNALDHIFKAVNIASKIESCDTELKEAKVHMERAGYDALELLAGSLGTSVIKKLEPYNTEALTNVFSEYYTDIRPKITEIRESIANRRMERKTDSEKSFFDYFNEIAELVQINTAVDRRIPSLQEYSDKKVIEKQEQQHEEMKKNKKERIWNYLWGPLIGFVSASIIAILSWLLAK